jgi:hypothetical protein
MTRGLLSSLLSSSQHLVAPVFLSSDCWDVLPLGIKWLECKSAHWLPSHGNVKDVFKYALIHIIWTEVAQSSATELNYVMTDNEKNNQFQSAPHKNLMVWGWVNVGVYLRNQVFADIYWYECFSLFWCGELTSEVCPTISYTLCMI